MNYSDKTTSVEKRAAKEQTSEELLLTVFDGANYPRTINLNDFKKDAVSFGRGDFNDIVLTSPLVSTQHGRFVRRSGNWVIEDRGAYGDSPSTNGLIYNNKLILSKGLSDGVFIRIDSGTETIPQGTLFVFSLQNSSNRWQTLKIGQFNEITIGRDARCSIVLPHISVSKLHARIFLGSDGFFYLADCDSTNGVVVNNALIKGAVRLHEKDVIYITNSKIIFSSSAIYYCSYKSGITVDASDVVIVRGKGSKSFVTCDRVSLSIKPGELVGIIGGSGAGKSTVLNAMCGYLRPASGEVYINGVDLYQNFDSLKKLIGYVPQSDIVYDNLTLHDMLMYTAKFRLPADISEAEREATINKAIETVELGEKKNSLIRSLSGGQRKRASIAVELLSDPNLLFLDEPASGLDPGTERNLMHSLRKMADGGKTVILVTHSTLQLRLCNKIVFMGKGGILCFYGSYDDALKFFGVDDIVDVYNLITDDPKKWNAEYLKTVVPSGQRRAYTGRSEKKSKDLIHQISVLCARYVKLIINDRQRLLLLLFQAPVLAFLISLVKDGNQYKGYGMTKSLLFALSCCAFWIGMLNAIQEICKERSILRREYMTGLSLDSYITSKMAVLGILCVIQSVMVVSVFALAVGLPKHGVVFLSYFEILFTTVLTSLSAAAMGLFVSSMFTNPDRAMTVAPFLLMPQMLFSGLLFKLEGVTKVISVFAICRWSMEGYGTTADLNKLSAANESFFKHTAGHLFGAWGIMILFIFVFLGLARVVLLNIKKD